MHAARMVGPTAMQSNAIIVTRWTWGTLALVAVVVLTLSFLLWIDDRHDRAFTATEDQQHHQYHQDVTEGFLRISGYTPNDLKPRTQQVEWLNIPDVPKGMLYMLNPDHMYMEHVGWKEDPWALCPYLGQKELLGLASMMPGYESPPAEPHVSPFCPDWTCPDGA